MAKNLIQEGCNITITATGTISSGDLVVVGALVGVAVGDATNGTDVAIMTEGVFDLPKTAGDGGAAVGDVMYYDASAAEVTAVRVVATGDRAIGVATAAATTGATTARVMLQKAPLVTEAVNVEYIQDTVGAMFTGNTETGIAATYEDSDGTIDLVVDAEFIQDTVGAMVTGNTESGITVTYEDSDGTLDFSVP